MAPLAPIIDQMRAIAAAELPTPQTCRIRLFDDDTYRACIYHSLSQDEMQAIRYNRTTSEILWEHHTGARWESESLGGGESIIKPAFDERTIRVVTTVDPPYK